MHVEGKQAATGELAGTIQLGALENAGNPAKKVMTLPFKGKHPIAAASGD
jgi:hypothetical protein